jgi:hypothetical protein
MPTQSVATIRSRLQRQFGSSITSLGIQNCRKKRKRDGTTFDGWSQHAWGNAWDFRVPSTLTSAVEAELDQLEAEGVSAGYISYGDGQFHVDGSPRKDPNSTPPCAGGDSGGSDAPPVMNPPRQDSTAGAPAPGPGPTGDPDEAETVEGGVRQGSPADRVSDVTSAWAQAGTLLGALADPDTWKRVGWAVGGLLLVVLGVYLLSGDLLLGGPVGEAAKGAAGAIRGGGS